MRTQTREINEYSETPKKKTFNGQRWKTGKKHNPHHIKRSIEHPQGNIKSVITVQLKFVTFIEEGKPVNR